MWQLHPTQAKQQPALLSRIIPSQYDGTAMFPAAPHVRGSSAFVDAVAAVVKKSGVESCTPHCASFVAAEEDSKRSKLYDDKGLFGLVCRHGMFLLGTTMDSGEKYAYGCMMLYVLAITQKCPVLFVWCALPR